MQRPQPPGEYIIPMVGPRFELRFDATCPLPFEELRTIVNELNAVVAAAKPRLRFPIVALTAGVVVFFGGPLSALFADGHVLLRFLVGFLGGALLMVIGGLRIAQALSYDTAVPVGWKISELNAKYVAQGVGFSHEPRAGHFENVLVIHRLAGLGGGHLHASAPPPTVGMVPDPRGAWQQPLQPPLQQPLNPMQLAPVQQPSPAPFLPLQQEAGMPSAVIVTCPPTTGVGDMVQVQAADGHVLQVQVPHGVGPGQSFQVRF